MRKTILTAVFVPVLIVVFILGLTGAVRLSDHEGGEEIPGGHFIGIFVSFEDGNAPFMSGSADGERYLFAEKETETVEGGFETVQYVFRQLTGAPFYDIRYTEPGGEMVTSLMAKRVSRVNHAIGSSDDGDTVSLTGILYLCTDRKETIIRIYPVYQADDERVYIDLNRSEGLRLSSRHPGADSTYTLSESLTLPDGQTESVSVSLQFVNVARPDDTVRVLEMNADNEVIRETLLDLRGTIGDLILSGGTSYVILEQQTRDDGVVQTERGLYTRQGLRAEAFIDDGDDVCRVCSIPLVWP